MQVERLVVGPLKENTYILKKDNFAIIIDPGAEIDKIKEKIKNFKVLGILITHHHFDHIGALAYFDKNIIYSYPSLKEKAYHIGPFHFEVIYTMGHSSDSISYYFRDDNLLFTGDFIFYENIGRCDLPTGNFEEMNHSIAKIKKYDDKIKIYPGHGKSTKLGHEKACNIYFN